MPNIFSFERMEWLTSNWGSRLLQKHDESLMRQGAQPAERRETQNAHLLQLVHAPHQLAGDRVQLQQVQAVESPFQHVDDGGQLRDKDRASQSQGGAAGGPAGAREGAPRGWCWLGGRAGERKRAGVSASWSLGSADGRTLRGRGEPFTPPSEPSLARAAACPGGLGALRSWCLRDPGCASRAPGPRPGIWAHSAKWP